MSDGSSPIRVLAVDDHPVVREGIGGLVRIQPDMALVAEAANGREAIQQFRTHRPDVTLMDLQMPEMNGLDALIAIRTEFPEARVIMLTTYEGDVHILRALKAGAQGYLLKSTLHSELLRTIRAVHAGKRGLSPEVSFEIAQHMSDETLTPAEVVVLRLIAAGNANKADRGSARRHRGHHQGSRQEHPGQAGCERSDACGHHRVEAGNHRAVAPPDAVRRPDPWPRLERVTTCGPIGGFAPPPERRTCRQVLVRIATPIFDIRWQLAGYRIAAPAPGRRLGPRHACGSDLWGDLPLYTTLHVRIPGGSGLLLIAGLWTPLAGAAVAVIEISQVLTMARDPLVGLMAAGWRRSRDVGTGSLVGRRPALRMEAHRAA